MSNTIRKNPTAEYFRAHKGAGGPLGGLITLQQSMSVSMATTATGQYNFGWRVPHFCDGGKVYRVGLHAWKNGTNIASAEDWADGTGDLKISAVRADRWRITDGALTTIVSKGDWLSTADTPTNLFTFSSMSPAIGNTVDNVDGMGYWEVSRENAAALFSISEVNTGDFLRLWITLTNGTGGTIVPFVTGFVEIDQIYP